AAVNRVVVGRGVRAVTIQLQLDQRRTVAGAGVLDGLAHDVKYGHRVHAVDAVTGHAVGARLVGDVRRPGLLGIIDTNRVAVVFAHENHRRVAHRGQIQGRAPVAFAGGAVAEGGDHDLVRALQLRRHGGTDGRR